MFTWTLFSWFYSHALVMSIDLLVDLIILSICTCDVHIEFILKALEVHRSPSVVLLVQQCLCDKLNKKVMRAFLFRLHLCKLLVGWFKSHPGRKLLAPPLRGGGCGLSEPRPHATRTVSFQLQSGSLTKTGTPTNWPPQPQNSFKHPCSSFHLWYTRVTFIMYTCFNIYLFYIACLLFLLYLNCLYVYCNAFFTKFNSSYV